MCNDVTTGWMTGELGWDGGGGAVIFLLTADSTPDMGLTECAIQWLSLQTTTQKVACV